VLKGPAAMLGFFYAVKCRQVLKSVKGNFGIDI
jgi:hypothetical protein